MKIIAAIFALLPAMAFADDFFIAPGSNHEYMVESASGSNNFYFAPGTYVNTNGPLTIGAGNAAQLIATGGATQTWLVAAATSRVVDASLAAYHVRIEGFTITGGDVASGYGGGVLFKNGGFGRLVDCVVTSNRTGTQYGGGVAYADLIDRCTVSHNYAGQRAGGVYYAKRLVNSLVFSNEAAIYAGGVQDSGGTNTVVAWNRSAGAAAIYSGAASYAYSNMTVIANVATNGSTFGQVHGGSFFSSTFAGNTNAGPTFSGTYLYYCVAASNVSASVGGASSSSYQYSSVFNGNSGVANKPLFGSSGDILNCTVLNQGGAAYSVGMVQPNADSFPLYNNLFVNCGTNIYNFGALAGTNAGASLITNAFEFLPDDPPYRLPPGSPAIDAGNSFFAKTFYDLYGRDRTQGTVDVGAVEYQLGIDDPAPDGGSSLLWILE